jgi:hypothetical protein
LLVGKRLFDSTVTTFVSTFYFPSSASKCHFCASVAFAFLSASLIGKDPETSTRTD